MEVTYKPQRRTIPQVTGKNQGMTMPNQPLTHRQIGTTDRVIPVSVDRGLFGGALAAELAS